jgi:hypothetical protein
MPKYAPSKKVALNFSSVFETLSIRSFNIRVITQNKTTGNKTPWSSPFKELYPLQTILI